MYFILPGACSAFGKNIDGFMIRHSAGFAGNGKNPAVFLICNSVDLADSGKKALPANPGYLLYITLKIHYFSVCEKKPVYLQKSKIGNEEYVKHRNRRKTHAR